MTQTDVTALTGAFDVPSEDQWRALVDKALKGGDFEKKLVSKTLDGLRIDPLYKRREGAQPTPTQHGQAPWRVSARVDHPDPKAAAAQALNDLTNGVDTLTLVFAGARSARGYGLVAPTVDALDAALDGVDLSMIRLRLDPAPGARIHAGLAVALLAKRGHEPADCDVEFGLDPIGSLTTTGGIAAAWPLVGERLSDAVKDLQGRGFAGPFITCDVRPYHEAGASEAQELAAALATGVTYLRALTEHGLSADDSAKALCFTLAIDADQFLSIAKLRALRRLWARVETACGLEPQPVRIHAETAWRMMSARDAWVNMLRTTMAAFAAGVGGADGLTVLPYPGPIGLADPFARRIARNQQTILIEESNVWRVSDPVAGAGGYEALTDQLCEAAWGAFQEIEREGGLIESLKSGALQARLATTREARRADVAKRKAPLTGTSEFPKLDEGAIDVLDVKPVRSATTSQSGNGPAPVTFAELVEKLSCGADATSLTGPAEADGLTIEALPSVRLGEDFEALRTRSDDHFAAKGARPEVFLACMGKIAQHTLRSTWTRNLLAAGGVEAVQQAGYETADAAADDFKANGAPVAVICSSDDVYAEMAVATAQALKAAGAKKVLVAGRPGDLEGALREAGVDGFIFAGQDMVALLTELQRDVGIPATA